MKRVYAAGTALTAAMLLAGCVSAPLGPTIAAMPGPNKTLEAFDQDDAYCQDYAYDRVAPDAKRASDRQARNTILGTAIGAGLGAAVGDTKGAIVGGVAGAAIGDSTSDPNYAQYSIQRKYDISYASCMKSKGNDVDLEGRRRHRHWHSAPPPPPPGY